MSQTEEKFFLSKLTCKFEKYSFEPNTALALVRILFFGSFFLIYFNRTAEISMYGLPENHWNETFWFRLLGVSRFSVETVSNIKVMWMSSMLFCAFGFLFRINSIIACLTGLYIVNGIYATGGDSLNWNYARALPVVFLLVFPWTNAHWKLSIDKFLFKIKEPHVFEGQWPILLMRVMFIFPFFFSSLHRITDFGFSFWSSNYLKNIISIRMFFECKQDFNPFRCNLFSYVSDQELIFRASYIFSQLLELSTPLAPFFTWARLFIVPSLAVFQIGIYLLLFEYFVGFLPTYFAWLPTRKMDFKDILKSGRQFNLN